MERRKADRLSTYHRLSSRQGERLRASYQAVARRNSGEFGFGRKVESVVSERGDMDRRKAGKVTQHVVGSDLVATIRWEWDAVGKE